MFRFSTNGSTWTYSSLRKRAGSACERTQECTRELLDKYIASIYWAFTTMTTVGCADLLACVCWCTRNPNPNPKNARAAAAVLFRIPHSEMYISRLVQRVFVRKTQLDTPRVGTPTFNTAVCTPPPIHKRRTYARSSGCSGFDSQLAGEFWTSLL